MLSVYSVGNDREAEKMKLFYILLTLPPVLNMVLLIKPFSSGGVFSRVGVFRGHPFSLGRSGRKSGGKALTLDSVEESLWFLFCGVSLFYTRVVVLAWEFRALFI